MILFELTPNKLPLLRIVERSGVEHVKGDRPKPVASITGSTIVKHLENVKVRYNKILQLPDRTLLIDTEESPDWFDILVTGWVPSLEYLCLYEEVSHLINVPTIVDQMPARRGFYHRLAVRNGAWKEIGR